MGDGPIQSRAWWRPAALSGATYAAYRYQPLRLRLRPGRPPEADRRITAEENGLLRLGARVLIVTAHPDDTEFFVGGVLLRLAETGAHLHLVVATDGDKGYYLVARPDALRRQRIPLSFPSSRNGTAGGLASQQPIASSLMSR